MARRAGGTRGRGRGATPRARGGRGSRRREGAPAATASYEAEVLPGLAGFAVAELRSAGAEILAQEEGAVRFSFTGETTRLIALRRCVAVYLLLAFDVPRPKALLGDSAFRRLTAELAPILARGHFAGFRFGAAGSDSPTFRRLAERLQESTGLAFKPDDGELLLRVRPGASGGWEVLVRLTPRPLSARAWRACNMAGGLNATVAAAAHDLLGVAADDRYLNLMCGSGTLLVERLAAGRAARACGCDIDPAALQCAAENLRGAGVEGVAELIRADATALPFPDASFDRLTADLPWGDAVGSHAGNAALYPGFLAEAARVATPAARLLCITHELALFDGALRAQREWRPRDTIRVFHGGHRPGLFLLERSA